MYIINVITVSKDKFDQGIPGSQNKNHMQAYVHLSLDKYYTNTQRPGKGSISTKTLNSDYLTGKGYFSFSQIIF